jgi:hypothetical protein
MAASDDLLARVQAHLKQVEESPETVLDEKLLDTAGYTLVPLIDPSNRLQLVLGTYQLLPTLQQDPTPVVRLLTKLLDPVPLADILSLQRPVDFVAGLDVAARPFNTLTLSLLGKADANLARRLAATQRPLFIALVRLWLATPDEGVADTASKVLTSLLKVDRRDSDTPGWDGPVWKRIFRDKDVYEQFFAMTDLKTGKDVSLNKNQKTIAQARLMDWLPTVGSMDWSSLSQSYHPEIESSYGLPAGKQSLLDYSASYMVDYKGDVLMHRSLIDFFSNLLQVESSGASLNFLVGRGIHSRTIAYYVEPDHPSHDPIVATFLYGPAGRYVGSWASK